jgi:tetratricopeptide (TPR) repeat protein
LWLFFLAFLFFPLNFFAFAQQAAGPPWWYTLEQGKYYFRSGSYGDALMAFEDARRSRLVQFTRMEQDFILFLSAPDARRLGDSLEFVEKYIADRHETAAAAILKELYYRVPRESLKGSVALALNELDHLKSYPEAEYWLGETYRAEGELTLALRQYERAWEKRELFESSEFDIEILYKITDIHRLLRNYQEMEKKANEIIEGKGVSGVPRDVLWAGNSPPSQNQIRAAMARILENEGVNRFLTLYRHNNTATEKAHRLLGFFCYATSRYSTAVEHLMFAFLIQNSVLIEEIIRRDFDFTFSTLDNLLGFVRTRPELEAFLEDTEYYKTIYYLASALFAAGKTRPSRELWSFLAADGNTGVWGDRARRNPSPFIERAIEMP